MAFVRNDSDSTYTGVRVDLGTVSGASTDGFGFDDNSGIIFPAIRELAPGATARAQVTLVVPPDTEAGSEIAFDLNFRNSSGLAVTLPFATTVAALPYTASLASFSVVNDASGDGAVSPGEEATLEFDLAVDGDDAYRCLGSDVSTIAQVTIIGRTGQVCSRDLTERRVRFRASSTLTPGTEVPFTIEITDGLRNTTEATATITIQ